MPIHSRIDLLSHLARGCYLSGLRIKLADPAVIAEIAPMDNKRYQGAVYIACNHPWFAISELTDFRMYLKERRLPVRVSLSMEFIFPYPENKRVTSAAIARASASLESFVPS